MVGSSQFRDKGESNRSVPARVTEIEEWDCYQVGNLDGWTVEGLNLLPEY
jgi:hypothetical protein